jgi:hypothetical protein
MCVRRVRLRPAVNGHGGVAGAATRRALTAVTAIMTADRAMTADTMIIVTARRSRRSPPSRRRNLRLTAATPGDSCSLPVSREAVTGPACWLPVRPASRRWRSCCGGVPFCRRGTRAGLCCVRAALRRVCRWPEAWLPATGGAVSPGDDLCPVSSLALVRAVDGYDPARPVAFASYAVPTIVGSLKRHFRDTTWQVRVPRRIQELAITFAAAEPTGRSLQPVAGATATRTTTPSSSMRPGRSWAFRRFRHNLTDAWGTTDYPTGPPASPGTSAAAPSDGLASIVGL